MTRNHFLIIVAAAAAMSVAACGNPVEPEKEKPFFSVSPTSFEEFGPQGGSFAFEVAANIEYSYAVDPSCTSWITFDGTKATTGARLSFKVAPNESEEPRTGAVNVTSSEGKVTVSVKQAGMEPVPPPPPVKSKSFDPTAVTASFAAISDTHVDGTSTVPGQKFSSALAQLRDKANVLDSDGLDGVLVAGDLINDAYGNTKYYDQAGYAKELYERVFDPTKVPLIYTIGNHDTYGWWTSNTISEAKNISSRLGEKYFRFDLDQDALKTDECRHCVVDGYHILTITPIGSSPVVYPATAVTWLDNTLAAITAETPEQYVLVFTHPMIYNTVYGSTLGNYWYTSALTDVLSKYPQAVTFSGHLHFPVNDPRSIWQGDFTSLGCGSVRYMAIEDGKYEDMAGSTTMKDKDDVSSGLLVQFDINGNMRVTRMFFSQNKEFGDPWETSYPQADRSHLARYNHVALKAANTAPTLGALKVEQSSAGVSAKTVTAVFDAGTDDEFVHHYQLNLKKGGASVASKKILSDFYRSPRTSDMKKSWSRVMGSFDSGEYELTLVAYDSWSVASEPVTVKFTVEAGDPDPVKDPEVYVDIDFTSGTVSDSKGNATITNKGATIGKVTMSHAGRSASVDAATMDTKGYVQCRFNEFSSFADMQTFACRGFTVEALYVDRSPGDKVHGIVCGTQYGGWGLAVRETGVPYFIVGDASYNHYESVDATAAASKTDLTHLVGVYDYAGKSIRIYVNGKLQETKSIVGPFYPGDKLAVNMFCLGDDIRADGTAGDFPCTDMVVVDAKFYTGALDASGVQKAYDASVAAFK